jgi:hypothetical protein
VEVHSSENPVGAHVSPGSSNFLCYFLTPLFCFVAGPSVPSGPLEATDVPASTPVSPVSGDEAIGQIFCSLISSLIMIDCLTCLFYCRCHIGGRETCLN